MIPLCDLEAENGPLRVELEAAARRVLTSNAFILGTEGLSFEKELKETLGVAHAVGVSSGTDALLALLLASGLGPGDEVVTTPFSFFATVEAIVRVGARPVFADIEPRTFNLDPELALGRVSPRTRAILAVHLFGRRAPLEPFSASCGEPGSSLPVLLEDAAQAIGLPSIPVGIGAAFSFHPSKNLGGFGDGGMVVTGSAELAARVRRLRSHGATEKFRHTELGGNFRLDEMQAALLRVKLPHLRAWTARRREVATWYTEGLADVGLALPPLEGASVWSRFVVRVPGARREALAEHLRSKGVSTAVYYPMPLHLQPALAHLGGRAGQFPVAERAAAEVLALPMHPGLDAGAVSRICDSVAAFFRR